jgi:hypothetical protein
VQQVCLDPAHNPLFVELYQLIRGSILCQSTDTTPLNAISKVSQVILSGAARTAGGSVVDAQRLNLLGASLTNIGANQGVGESYISVRTLKMKTQADSIFNA